MLSSDPARQRVAFFPLVFLVAGTAFALLGVSIAMTGTTDELLGTLVLAGLGAFGLAWFVLSLRFAQREGDQIRVRSVLGTCLVAVEGSTIGIVQGGGSSSSHLDVLIQPMHGEPLRVARLEIVGVRRAPALARKIAAALGLPIDEKTVMPVEAQLTGPAQQGRMFRPLVLAVVAIGVVGIITSVTTMAIDDTATVVFLCPGGKTESGTMTLTGEVEMTFPPGRRTFKLHPASGAAWTKQVELVSGQRLILDCSDRSNPAGR